MKIENPYTEDKWPNDGPTGRFHTRPGDNSVCYTSSELTASHDAWGEGYHSRDLAVGKLVEACSAVIVDQDEYGLITNHTLDLLEAVIAETQP